MSATISETKVCTKCGTEKHISEYSKSSKGKNGLSASCKKCDSYNSRKFYWGNIEINRERANKNTKAHYLRHREKINAKTMERRRLDKINNPDKYAIPESIIHERNLVRAEHEAIAAYKLMYPHVAMTEICNLYGVAYYRFRSYKNRRGIVVPKAKTCRYNKTFTDAKRRQYQKEYFATVYKEKKPIKQAEFRERHREETREKMRLGTKNLEEWYVRQVLSSGSPLSAKDFPTDVVEAKRSHLMIKRLIDQLKQKNTTNENIQNNHC